MSRLARALWIEIIARLLSGLWCNVEARESLVDWNCYVLAGVWNGLWSRLARALWIEIFCKSLFPSRASGRGSREPCGLKLLITVTLSIIVASRLARALWIEIAVEVFGRRYLVVEARESLVDWNLKIRIPASSTMSRLARALWIEITIPIRLYKLVDGRGSREPCGLKSG